MVSWKAFFEVAPVLAGLGRERFERTDLTMLGTIRRDGFPRISPVEFLFFEDDLTTGGMWQSKKCLDLLREPRCTLHSTTSDKAGTQGDFKLYGRAVPMDDPATRARYEDALVAAIGWKPSRPYHLFRIDIESAGFIVFGPEASRIEPEVRAAAGAARVRRVRVDPDDAEPEGYMVVTWRA
jgi:hypothetical protein